MYEIYIGSLKLPLLPESLKEDIKRDNKHYTILALGEVIKAFTFQSGDIQILSAPSVLNR